MRADAENRKRINRRAPQHKNDVTQYRNTSNTETSKLGKNMKMIWHVIELHEARTVYVQPAFFIGLTRTMIV